MHNPSLREEPLKGRAPIVPMSDTLSILDWLKAQGRLIEVVPTTELNRPEEEDISVLMGEEEKYDDED
ncbi:DUF3134 family protein [Synechococcus sp. PCC 7336]|uniref:DUF3134 family protein n=1 Tax=Synechococcus sp. PCC 7336 TaxID=195250 RepID=UPI000347FD3A|nr:DUF3134 family protein [Synechococcus sp. PCC 7336]